MKRKRQSGAVKTCKNPQSRLYKVRGKKRAMAFLNDGYRPAMIGGHYVKLYDPQCSKNNWIESEDAMMDLRVDLKKAFSQFKGVEYRVLYRLLVQGQSMDKATQRMKRSREYWRTWYQNVALPKLCESLASYFDNKKVVL